MKKAFSITLAFTLLLSSIGMAKSTHFCDGFAMMSELAFSAKHVDCGMESTKKECTDEEAHSAHFNNLDCCENSVELINLDEDLSLKKSSVDLNPIFAFSLIHSFILIDFSIDSVVSTFQDYHPPIVPKDIPTLYQSFLI